ncbi:Arylsulfatase A [Robiginitalea myxolifaciens]|uniref:Arylsulfatase A n=1 Tax=Robiginitalea myxolifaciens TaxID=400055 RepID=A0A1I6HAR5_9FLAO|nr:arylsulfatase [Robiginitalea myxolifaciens]SFR51586.1 Arylsulfatase A [Robiginitalea myxolifaciens]
MRPIYYLGLLLLWLTACQGHKTESSSTTSDDRPPNVIVILTDDQGWGDLSFNGNRNFETPNLDRLARESIVFDNFYVQPVCSPTRAELLTGRYFTSLGVFDTSAGGERMDSEVPTIADYFNNAGYATAAFGKWHNGMQAPYHPNARGFEEFYGFASGHWGNYFSPILEHNGEVVRGEGYLADDLTTHAISYIENHQEEPFLLYLALNTPHSPMQVPDSYWEKFRDRELRQRYAGDEPEDENFTRAALAMVSNIDDNVGRVVAQLETLELAENTIVVYLSDNGPNGWRYNGGMRGKKGSTDEGGVRSPCFIRWKGNLPAGKRLDHIASALDLFPTLANLTGLDTGRLSELDGRNIAPLLHGESQDWQDHLIFNHWNGKTSIRSQDFRLDEQGRLYEIRSDRGQLTKVNTRYPEIEAQLQAARDLWTENTLGQGVKDRPYTLGHPDYSFTHLPARDGSGFGAISRSNKYPNDSFFMGWAGLGDSIVWDVNVLEEGDFEVDLYATVKPDDVGAVIQLTHGENQVSAVLDTPHDPPLQGMNRDRVPRIESYTKEFKAFQLGTIHLEAGRDSMVLKALEVPGKGVADVRLLVFRRK